MLARWFAEEHHECESAKDLFVAVFEDLHWFLEERAVTDAEYEHSMAYWLHVLLRDAPPELEREVLAACQERLSVTISRAQ